ncbi:MAG: NADH-quinone oxidoreductase subunit NuoF [Elusimicrobia bacterium]|nr:NADH-quinone oxidoreductase subunit NuoF [Elusimicrobiota bacterium]
MGQKRRIVVCAGAGCFSCNSAETLSTLQRLVKERGVETQVDIVPAGCMGACQRGPLVQLPNDDILLQGVGPQEAAAVLDQVLGGPAAPAELKLYSAREPDAPDAHFFQKQQKIVLENCGRINPESLDEYIAVGGYQALHRMLSEMTREAVVAEIKKSGLRGRGGAGYPTGLKWETVAKMVNEQKYVICNADEGDPGAFMDRSVLEGDPHRVLEGMAIAGYAVGANKGFVYVRAEYPLAIKRLELAIKGARREGLLGREIFRTSFSFDVEIRIGAGAFVCGEETALIASIEGRRGQPRPRPPYPAESGLWGKPTLINNVETFANIAPILTKGGEWFSAIGTPKNAGTKVFALAGKIRNTGLIEVPMGITLREIIFDIGGGIPGGRRFKAVQTGGPSGGCIPEAHLDTHVDYESLQTLGSIMGSGGFIVMDDTSCMVDVARFFMEFCMDESCGKCVPCRVGTKHMHDLLAKICAGHATMGDLALLEELAPMVKATSLCGLGMTAPNPLISTLRYFRDEYAAHIRDRRCPAGVCSMDAVEALR